MFSIPKPDMKLEILPTAGDASKYVARIISERIKQNPKIVLGLATGRTPIIVYKELVSKFNNKEIDFNDVKTFNLDEFYGLDKNHPLTFRGFMKENLFKFVNLQDQNIYLPDSSATNPVSECQNYENSIKACGGIDLQLLGLGINGHIAFNEPGTSFNSRTQLINLASDTIEYYSEPFGDISLVPKTALTMGMQTIMETKECILLVTGRSKREILRKVMSGEITEEIPASILNNHKNLRVIVDQEAA